MQDTSRLIINHIRIMIEEAEHTKAQVKVSFVYLANSDLMKYAMCSFISRFLPIHVFIAEIVFPSTTLSCNDVL